MADFSKLNGYNVKDAVARAALEEKVDKSVLDSKESALKSADAAMGARLVSLEGLMEAEKGYHDASGITYDNTTSGLGAETVAAALDELKVRTDQTAPTSAKGLTYDNSKSGLAAINAQDAIDELLGKMGESIEVVESLPTTPEAKFYAILE